MCSDPGFLGTPRAVSDAHGKNVWRADYSPFGEANISRQTITLNLRFPGQYFDAETGTHYNYLRDYDPKTGRYLTSDPIGLKILTKDGEIVIGKEDPLVTEGIVPPTPEEERIPEDEIFEWPIGA